MNGSAISDFALEVVPETIYETNIKLDRLHKLA